MSAPGFVVAHDRCAMTPVQPQFPEWQREYLAARGSSLPKGDKYGCPRTERAYGDHCNPWFGHFADLAGWEHCRPRRVQVFTLRFARPAIQDAVLPASLVHRHCCTPAAPSAELVCMGSCNQSCTNGSACVLEHSPYLPESRAVGESGDRRVARDDTDVGSRA